MTNQNGCDNKKKSGPHSWSSCYKAKRGKGKIRAGSGQTMIDKTNKSRAVKADWHNEALWRREVASRVRRHRTLRGKNPDSETTQALDFPEETPSWTAPAQPAFSAEPHKVIPFPRRATAPTLPTEVEEIHVEEEEELAEPVERAPRIVEAAPIPQQLDFFSSFDDIRLESERNRPVESLDLPPRPASLQQRLSAALADMLVVMTAGAGFSVLFMSLAGGLPETRMVLACTAAVCAVFWMFYQYLFLVYDTGTPGMKI